VEGVVKSPFNPLSVPNVALTLALELLEQPLSRLPPISKFAGAGIYAIYYTGSFPLYAALVAKKKGGNLTPIYVGKAQRKGHRRGIEFTPTAETALLDRLKAHARSIGDASNLNVEDFQCKYLVVEEAFISLAESVLIGVFRPLWNQLSLGFGSNSTGVPRSSQAASAWDVIHPGRQRGLGAAKLSLAQLEGKILEHFKAAEILGADKELDRIAARIKKYTH
jgi:Eco29kI restriction endonuclease